MDESSTDHTCRTEDDCSYMEKTPTNHRCSTEDDCINSWGPTIAAALFCLGCLAVVAGVVCMMLFIPGKAGQLGDKWPSDGNGLNMTVVNSLDPWWTQSFNEYIDIYDNGTPDSLTLTMETGNPSGACI